MEVVIMNKLAMDNRLIDVRKNRDLYTIEELCDMFSIGRAKIDDALNNHDLSYISPNGRKRFVYLDDFLKHLEKNKKTVKQEFAEPADGTTTEIV